MKAEPSLKVVKGKAASGTRPRRRNQPITKSPPEVMSLISLENQKASRPELHSLQEAQSLLDELLFQVRDVKNDLDEVHLLQERCLVRLW